MIKDLVSIIVPTYNDAPYLKKAIDDILEQTYAKIEILVVNDGSTDNTEEIMKKYCLSDERVKYFYKENGGTGSALNLGFSKATGEFGTWVSSDDRKSNVMIETLVSFLKNNRDVEYVTSAFESEYLGRILRSYTPDPTRLKGYRHNFFHERHNNNPSGRSFKVDNWVDINFMECHQGVNFMFTMNLKNRCGDYIEIPGEDYYMAVKMGLNSRAGYIDKVLGKHQAPPDSLSVVNRNCVNEANLKTRKLVKDKHTPWKLQNIPKIAHFYWDSSVMSYMRYMTIKSFKTYNPDWSAVLYLPHDYDVENKNCLKWKDESHKTDSLEYEEQFNYFDKLKEINGLKIVKVDFTKTLPNSPPAHRSDFLRWNLLANQGGVWCDMDILFSKPLSSSSLNRDNLKHTDTVVCYHKHHGISIGFLMSSPKNKVFKEISKKSLQVLAYLENQDSFYQSFGSLMINKVYDSEEKLRASFPDSRIVDLEDQEVYYYDFKELDKIYEENNLNEILDSSIGIHWYGGHPLSQKYNNKINHTNYQDFDSTVCKIIDLVNKQSGII